jgi:hypothetical protein
MRLAKTEALKKDIEILSQNHERDVDRKDAILQVRKVFYCSCVILVVLVAVFLL